MLKVATVCSGIGAPEKALKLLEIPYDLSFFSEISSSAIKSYCAIHNELPSENFGDLMNINAKVLPQDLDLFVGGTPCQDFSVAGLGRGGEENSGTRSSLMWYYVRLISLAIPKVVVWKNVSAVLSCKHIKTYRKFYHTLNALGYNVYSDLLNSKNFNVAQSRERIFVIALRYDLENNFTFPHGYDSGIRIRHILQKQIPKEIFTKSIEDAIPFKRKYSNTYNIMNYGILRNSNFRKDNAVILIDGLSDCRTTHAANYIIDDRIKRIKTIRRFTSLESFRLMGFEDKDFFKCRYKYLKNAKFKKKERYNFVSDNDLIFQSGNSIVVTVLMALFGQLYNVPWKQKVFKERYKSEEELYNELPLFSLLKEGKNDKAT